ncbi:uncharacterized protein LOC120775208 [Bactrocera tryoni]|uniref:uncharacterized protein LOC120775208 n=1 Tax=Bactrocera tryoni TaxID=59916 RepID=UPI001A98C79C|nr:uncharacterized protein LOC120775208 [Bactrocera tryoni]
MKLQIFTINNERLFCGFCATLAKTINSQLIGEEKHCLSTKFLHKLENVPKKSFREKLTDALINEAAEEIMDIDEIESDDDAVDAVLDELADNISVMECRRGVYCTIPKSDIYRNNILTTLDEDRFRQMLRVDRDQYKVLVELIKNDEQFNKARSCKQFSVE